MEGYNLLASVLAWYCRLGFDTFFSYTFAVVCETFMEMMHDLCNTVFKENKSPEDW